MPRNSDLKKQLLLALMVAIFASLWFQCEKKIDENHLLRINGTDYLHKDEFLSRYAKSKNFQQAESFSEADLKGFIDNEMTDELMFLLEAERLGYDQSELIERAPLELQKRKIITQNHGLLYQKVLPRDFKIDSAAIAEYYEMRKYKLKLARIIVESKTLADSLYAQLQNGADFAQLAREYSADIESGQNGGELPNPVVWGVLEQTIEPVAFGLNMGEFSKPVYSNFMYQIIKLNDKIANKQKPFAKIERMLKMHLFQIRRSRAIERYTLGLYDKYDVELLDAAIAIIRSLYDSSKREGRLQLELTNSPSVDADKILVRFADQQWTVADFVEKFNRNGTVEKIPLRNSAEVKRLLRRMLVLELSYVDGKSLELDQTPEFVDQMKFFRTQVLVKKGQDRAGAQQNRGARVRDSRFL